MKKLLRHIDRVLFTKEQIQERVSELADRISKDYKGKDLVLVGVLKGGVIFLSDLSRRLAIPHSFDMIGAASYGSSTASAGHVMITKDIDSSITKKHVLLVEDIYDTGRTLKVMIDMLKTRRPASIEVCCLLKKRKRSKFPISLKYKGFQLPDTFVVGYGLDFDEKYRHLDYIASLKENR